MSFAILTSSLVVNMINTQNNNNNNNNNNNDNNNNANQNMFTITVTNMNMNTVMGRSSSFFTFLSLLKEPLVTSLQRLMISSKAGEPCGLLLWCHLGNLIKGSSTDIDRAQQFLLYLALADLVGTSGKVIASLAALHRNSTVCDH